MFYLLVLAAPATTAEPKGGLGGLLLFLPLILAFYFFGVRPNKRRMQAQQSLVKALAPGDQIETAAGMYGTIRAADDATLDVEIAPGVVVKMARLAVRRQIMHEPEMPRQDATPPHDVIGGA